MSESGGGRRRAAALAAAVLVLVLAGGVGCSPGEGMTVSSAMIRADARDLRQRGFTEQADMLADGEVTAREYQDAFDSMRRCVEEAGLRMTGPYIDPLDGFSFDFTFRPGGGEGAVWKDGDIEIIDECEDRYFVPLGADYEGSHVGQLDPVLREAVAECMGREGFELSGEERTVQDFVGESGFEDDGLTGRADAATACFHSQMMRLYSDREVVGGLSFS